MMFRGKIAAVSYLNTVPFIYGIEHAENLCARLLLSPPSGCAAAFNAGKADIALLPVGALSQVRNSRVIASYCIGSVGPVRTVVIMHDGPLQEIRRVWLDSHSMTSALLVKILCHEYWKINPRFEQLDDYGIAERHDRGDAFLFIGDKVFDYEGRFENTHDLAVSWRDMTGLPFVFAVWVAGENVDSETVCDLEHALGYGVRHIREAINQYGHSGKRYAYDYLTHNIDYTFDSQKQKALALFWEKGRKFTPRAEPG